MSSPATCPKCGAALPSDAPQGLCPACLLAQAAGPSISDWSAEVAGEDMAPTGAVDEAASSTSNPAVAPTTPFTPGGRFAAPTAEELAPRFPQLEIIELIGRGGMGAVYKARQPGLDRLVALKILPPDPAAGAAFAERFTREARALARLSHPNIVAVYDFGQADGLFYFLMEYVDGANLRQAQQAGHLQPAQALKIVPQICEALQYAHDEGIVHRDIKPENVLLDRRGRVKIADFGLAKLLAPSAADRSLTGSQQVMGTYHYMAPEQMERPGEVDHRADIYALGVVFYEMLTGELPLGRFAPPSQVVEVDVRLDDVVLRTLEKKPERRYQQASQLKTEVDSIASSPAKGGRGSPEAHAAGVGVSRGARPLTEAAPEPMTEHDFDAARAQVRAPAIGLLTAGIINLVSPILFIVLAMLAAMFFVSARTEQRLANITAVPLLMGMTMGAPPPPLMGAMGVGPIELLIVSSTCLNLPIAILTILGAVQMKGLGSRGLAYAGAIAALFPCGIGWILGLPMGIWSLVVLGRPGVRRAFGRQGTTVSAAPFVANATSVRSQYVPRTSVATPTSISAIKNQVGPPAIALIVVAVLVLLLPVGVLGIMAATWSTTREVSPSNYTTSPGYVPAYESSPQPGPSGYSPEPWQPNAPFDPGDALTTPPSFDEGVLNPPIEPTPQPEAKAEIESEGELQPTAP
jgi:predicted Ser/Thr protein kinase